ncbi:nifU-like protein 4, mitochondrial [Rutidosis leptorrhynchoides]|uniref:nifU-like protein 4, mitochondrial n=1 Tax=Rutidosis leptorrhynchoides TaxID=125765 RepID=UPI003A991758
MSDMKVEVLNSSYVTNMRMRDHGMGRNCRRSVRDGRLSCSGRWCRNRIGGKDVKEMGNHIKCLNPKRKRFENRCILTLYWTWQRRSMFIQTQSTPNLQSLMFYPGKPVMEVGSADFPNARTAMNSPLAKALFGIDGVTRVFFGSNFVTVTKSDDTSSWDFLKPEIFAAIIDFYSSGKSLFLHSSTAAALDTAIHQDDSETVAMIKQLLETRIRPAVQDDSGDIEYIGFDPESGIVKLKMQGACSGCPSSSGTLKSGIENMLMHYVPEVSGNKRKWNGNYDRGNQQ